MIKTLGAGLFVAIIGLGLGARTRTLQAEDKVDCSKIQRWKDLHNYNRGEVVALVRYADGATEYKCNDLVCGSQPPGHPWDRVADCQQGTEPK